MHLKSFFCTLLIVTTTSTLITKNLPELEEDTLVVAGKKSLTPLEKRNFQFTNARLAIVIDDTENEGKCAEVSGQLKILMEQKACPIITSSSLFKTTLGSCLSNYNPNDWINRKLDERIYLLVPKYYLTTIWTPIKGAGDYTARELALGLKIDHLPEITNYNMRNLKFHLDYQETPGERPLPISRDFSQAIGLTSDASPLFITNAEYAQAGVSSYIPKFTFYMIGHGQQYESIEQEIKALQQELPFILTDKQLRKRYQQEIKTLEQELKKGKKVFRQGIMANLEISDLQNFLDFAATKITTRFIFIETCFGADINLKEALQLNNQGLGKTYPFTLISGALGAAPLEKYHSSQPYKFNTFFEKLTGYPPIDFEDVLHSVYAFHGEEYQGDLKETIANIPTLKIAGREWTEVLDLPGKIVSIGRVMARSRTTPLHLNSYFAGRRTSKLSPEERKKKGLKPEKKAKLIYPDMILLYPYDIPFEITIKKDPSGNNQHFPALVSMQAGPAIHRIKGIQAPEFTLKQFIDSLKKMNSLQEYKTFYIDKLTIKNDISKKIGGTSETPITLEKVLFINRPGKTAAEAQTDLNYQELHFVLQGQDWYTPNGYWSDIKKAPNRKTVIETLNKLNKEIRSQSIDPSSALTSNLSKLKNSLAQKHIEQSTLLKEEQQVMKNLVQSLKQLATNTFKSSSSTGV